MFFSQSSARALSFASVGKGEQLEARSFFSRSATQSAAEDVRSLVVIDSLKKQEVAVAGPIGTVLSVGPNR